MLILLMFLENTHNHTVENPKSNVKGSDSEKADSSCSAHHEEGLLFFCILSTEYSVCISF